MKMSLKTKFLLQLVVSMTITLAIIIGYINLYYTKYTINLSYKLTAMYSTELAQNAESILKGDMKLLEGMKELFEYYAENQRNYSLEVGKEFLSAVLINNPRYLAVWLIYELKFIDPSWKLNYGRVRTIAKLESGKVVYMIDTLDTEGDNIKGLYYKMKTGQITELLSDPYFFTYKMGDTIDAYLEASLGKNLYYNNQFIGAVGIDVSLKSFNNLISGIKPFKDSYSFIVSNGGDIVAHPNDEYLGKYIYNVYPALRDYYLIDSIKKGKQFYVKVKDNQSKREYLFAFSPINVVENSPWSLVYVVPLDLIVKEAEKNLRISLILSIIAILVIATFVYIIVSNITEYINQANKVLIDLSKGASSQDMKLKVKRNDEIGIMYQAINSLIDSLHATAKFAREIGKGNLDAYFELRGENDELGKSLIEMKMSLINAKKQEKERKIESEKLSWLQNGVTEINEILRLENEDLEKLSFELIKFIVRYMEANQGGFYIVEKKEDKEIVKLIVAYAYDRKKQLEAELEIGEGLVGRAIKEKTIVQVTDLPQGYVFLSSGLGDKTPDNLVIVPLIFEERVYGAIEVLSFKKFEEHHLEFLEQAAQRIASSVSNILKNIETAKLLEQSQQQAIQLKQKEESLNKRLEELAEIRQEVEELKRYYQSFMEWSSKVIAIAEYNKDMVLVSVNEYLLSLLGVEQNEILAKPIEEILSDAKENPKWFEKFKEDLKNGHERKKISKYIIGNTNIILQETYIPVMNKENKLEKIICFGINITTEIILKEEVKKLKQKLKDNGKNS